MKFQEKYAPSHVTRDYTYEEHREEAIREGWAPNMIEEIIQGRLGQRRYYCKIMYGREYYQRYARLSDSFSHCTDASWQEQGSIARVCVSA